MGGLTVTLHKHKYLGQAEGSTPHTHTLHCVRVTVCAQVTNARTVTGISPITCTVENIISFICKVFASNKYGNTDVIIGVEVLEGNNHILLMPPRTFPSVITSVLPYLS